MRKKCKIGKKAKLTATSLVTMAAFCSMNLLFTTFPAKAFAGFTTGDPKATTPDEVIEYVGDDYAGTIGGGRSHNYDGWRITIGDGSTTTKISVVNTNAISVYNAATILVKNGATVTGNSNINGGGLFGTGPNVIEVYSNANITIEAGGLVQQLGNTTNGEAINVHGVGNTITNYGAILSNNAQATIWFQDEVKTGAKNKVDNYGQIIHVAGGNVIGTSGGAGITFINQKGALVSGNLKFAGGNDDLTFYNGSIVLGSVDGGGGDNVLNLDGVDGDGIGILDRTISNFPTLNKNGTGTWLIKGTLQGYSVVNVNDGILGLLGNNSNFTGKVTVNPSGILEARAQSLPTNSTNTDNILNEGIVRFTQDDTGTYVGQITGNGSVEKTGVGTVFLNPQAGNTYTGGTYINQGTLAIASDNALGDTTGGLYLGDTTSSTGFLQFMSDLTLDPNRTVEVRQGGGAIDTNGFTGTLEQGITGTGELYKIGNGTLVLNGSNSLSGDTYIEQGVLRVMSTAANNFANSKVTVQNGSRLEGTGLINTTNKTLLNAGTIAPGIDGNASGVLTINGDIRGNAGGTVEINSVLGDSSSATSKLVIDGNVVVSSSMDVKVINRGGLGAATTGNGIEIIDVTGSSASDAFRLAYDYKLPDGRTAVIAGNYLYSLNQGSDGNWYLRNLTDATNPAIPLYEVYPQILLRYQHMTTLEERVGNRQWEEDNGDEKYGVGIWVRTEGLKGEFKSHKSTSSNSTHYDMDFWRIQLGADRIIHKSKDGSKLIAGINIHRGEAKSNVGSKIGNNSIDINGDIKVNGEGVGGTLTWYKENGSYLDFQTEATWFKSDISSHDIVADRQTSNNHGFGYSISLEAGRKFNRGEKW